MLKILIVDDSAFMRLLISDLVSRDPSIEVVGTASDGLEAKKKVLALNPNVVILDINMSGNNGIYAVKEIMKKRPTPILILSSAGNTDLQPVLEALKLGAVDYMKKPNLNTSNMREVRDELIRKVKNVSLAKLKEAPKVKKATTTLRAKKNRKSNKYEIIAIGASTGGPAAIESIINALPDDFNIPIITCQHMPKSFIPPFVHRLNAVTNLEVVAATKGMCPKPGVVMFCPGHSNLFLTKKNGIISVDFTRKVFNGYNNPSINAMMKSVAKIYERKAIGIILTGMGKDGLEGMKLMWEKGALTLAQDKKSSVIYGMPRVAVEAGVVAHELDIKKIGNYLRKEL